MVVRALNLLNALMVNTLITQPTLAMTVVRIVSDALLEPVPVKNA